MQDAEPVPDIRHTDIFEDRRRRLFDTIKCQFAALSYVHVETADGAGVSTETGEKRDADYFAHAATQLNGAAPLGLSSSRSPAGCPRWRRDPLLFF